MRLPESLWVLVASLLNTTQSARPNERVRGLSPQSGVLAGSPGRALRRGREAAVLALIGDAEADPFIVFVEKLASLKHHAGQIAFPGGRSEPTDRDAVETALREAQEETGVDPSGVEVFGTLPPAYLNASDWDVTMAVGWWKQPVLLHPADETEIAAVHSVPVADLVNPANRSTYVHPHGFRGPAFDVAGVYIWGFTSGLVSELLDLAGWAEPWDASRETQIPARFLAPRLG